MFAYLLSAVFVFSNGWQSAVQTSEQLQEQGRLRDAEQVLMASLQDESGLGAHGLAYVYNNLGSIYQDQRRFAEARRHYLRAIAEWERAGDAHRPALARTLNNFASLLWETGQLAEAESVLIRSYHLQINVAGANQPEAAQWFYNLATLYLNQNQWTEAEAAYRKFLAVEDARRGDALKTAVAAGNLALICRKAGRNAEADLLLQKARMIWEQASGQSGLSPVLTLDLASGFLSGNALMEAESAGKQAVTSAEQHFGEAHPRTAQALTVYAAVLRRLQRKSEAREMEKRARRIESQDGQTRLSRETIDVNELAPRGTWNQKKRW